MTSNTFYNCDVLTRLEMPQIKTIKTIDQTDILRDRIQRDKGKKQGNKDNDK